jgi:hypothetical protein
MSDNVLSYGFIAVIAADCKLLDLSALSDKLWSDKSPLGVNYEGTLVYADFNRIKSYTDRTDFYGLFIGKQDEGDVAVFKKECAKYGIYVDQTTRQPYNCIWYNGSDSPMDELTKEEFLKK